MSKDEAVLEGSPVDNPLALERVTGTLTVTEQKSADTRYKERIEYFQDKDRGILKNVLQSHWEKGRFVGELFQNSRHWGNHTAEQFANDMGISKEIVYAYQRFFENFTEEEVKEAVDNRVSWHNIFYLLSVKDKPKRRQLMLQAASGAITNQQLQDKVKGTNKTAREKAVSKGLKVDKRGGTTAKTVLRSTTTMCVDIVRKLPEYRDAHKAFEKLDDGPRKVEMAKFMKDCRSALKKTRDQIDRVLALDDE